MKEAYPVLENGTLKAAGKPTFAELQTSDKYILKATEKFLREGDSIRIIITVTSEKLNTNNRNHASIDPIFPTGRK